MDIRLHNFSRVEVKEEDSSSIIVDSSRMMLYGQYIDLKPDTFHSFWTAYFGTYAGKSLFATIVFTAFRLLSRILSTKRGLLSTKMKANSSYFPSSKCSQARRLDPQYAFRIHSHCHFFST